MPRTGRLSGQSYQILSFRLRSLDTNIVKNGWTRCETWFQCGASNTNNCQGATWFNTGELERVVKIVLSLLNEAASSSPPLSAGEIAVMAPWREQVWRLREAFRNKGLRDVDVGTIEEGA